MVSILDIFASTASPATAMFAAMALFAASWVYLAVLFIPLRNRSTSMESGSGACVWSLIGEMSCRGPVRRGTVYLSSGIVRRGNVRSGTCLVGELSCRGPVRRVTIRRGTVYRGSVLGEVSSRGNVISKQCIKYLQLLPLVNKTLGYGAINTARLTM